MPIEEMSHEDLLALHRETLAKARRARMAEDLETAQRYLRILRPIDAEMSRRMAAINAKRIASLFAGA